MDGVDVALLDTDGEALVHPGPSHFLAYGEDDRALLRAAIAQAGALDDRRARPGVLRDAEAMIDARHAEAVEEFLALEHLARESIDVVGFHGQTVSHRPERRLTIQLGDGAALAQRLRLPVIHDFRAADVAAGGQGAPLVPVYHRALADAAGLGGTPVALVNIGGVSNLTYVAPGVDPVACDCGPGNALIDDLMRARVGAAMDRGGACGMAGAVDPDALARLLDHPYFAAPAPKSLDRNAFARDAVEHLSTLDAAATLAHFTAEAIAIALRAMPAPASVVAVCGGGAKNTAIMRALARRTNCEIVPAERFGWSSDAMEAQAFAYLAARSLRGLPLTFPGTTGVSRALGGGVLEVP